MKIRTLEGREILDSRGMPTIECRLMLSDGFVAVASVPSGASVGEHEALELRDHDMKRFRGQGVLKAIANVEQKIAPLLVDKAPDVKTADAAIVALDGTENKSNLGANATLAASMAVARAQAHAQGVELYELFADLAGKKPLIPQCMFNIFNGGMHANNDVPFQEFMVMPVNQKSIKDSLQIASVIYHELKQLLSEVGYLTTVGDEGGFAPRLTGKQIDKDRAALDFLVKAIERAGFAVNKEVVLCLDVAASHFYDGVQKTYLVDHHAFDSAALVAYYAQLIKDYPIWSIEDGLSQDDWAGWQLLTQELGKKVCLIGDDIFVTNPKRIERGIKEGTANAVLIKPNQIGTVTETLRAMELATKAGLKTVISHRSGETPDSFIADFSVGTAAGYLKAGACARGERVAKYNRLMEIEAKMLKNG